MNNNAAKTHLKVVKNDNATYTTSTTHGRLKAHDGSGGGGDDMLERVKKLEERVVSISSDLAVIKATLCTKEDLHKELNGQTWKIVLALVVTVLIATLSKYYIK